MKKIRFVCSLLLFLFVAQPVGANAEVDKVILVYATRLSDIQASDLGALPHLATLLKELRKENENVVFFHGGSALGLSPMSSFDKGAHMISLINMLNPAFMAVGRRDFAHGEDELALRARFAMFPFISSNIIDRKTGKIPEDFEDSFFIRKKNYSIGFGCLTSSKLAESYLQKNYSVVGDYVIMPQLSKQLRENGADLVVIIGDIEEDIPKDLIEKSDLDVLISPKLKKNGILRIGSKLIVEHGSEHFAFILALNITKNKGKKAVIDIDSVNVVPLIKYEADAEIQEVMVEFRRSLKDLLSLPVGQISTLLDTTRKQVRCSENAFGNIVTDAMLDYYASDFSAFNGGAIRGDRTYPTPVTLTRLDIQTELPLTDEILLLGVSGQEMVEALEHGVGGVEYSRGSFLHVSGLRYVFDSSLPRGKRIKEVLVNEKPIELDKIYSLAIPSFLGEGGDGYDMFTASKQIRAPYSAQTIVELVTAYIEKKSPVSMRIEGRIVDLATKK